MAKEYKVGMVAELLGGGTSPGGKLANLFSSPNTAVFENKESDRIEKLRAKKQGRKEVKGSSALKGKKKSRQKTHFQSHNSEEENTPESQEISSQSLQFSEGFRPPPGIIHEALAKSAKIKVGSKRRRTSVVADDDEDNDSDGDISKNNKRPRRDRLKKATENRTVFVGNVPLTADKKKLTKLFREFGTIENVRFRCAPVADPTTKKRVAVIMKEFHDQRHNISAYVCFKEKESAEKALSLNGHLLDGLHIRVDSAKPNTKQVTKRSIFVGNLPFDIEEESIRSHFEDCGKIENVRVIRDRKTNLGKGFCYILFESKDSLSLAMKLNKSALNGRQLRVERCTDQTKTDKKTDAKKKSINSSEKKTTAGALQANTKKAPEDKKSTKTKMRNKMWRPTNASNMQALQLQKTALKKKWRHADKKKKKRNKVDEVTRVLGPMQQPSSKTVACKKTKTTKNKLLLRKKGTKGSKAEKKVKKVRR